MRILLVHNRYRQPGGEDAVFESEAALLRAHRHEVRTLTADNGSSAAPELAARTLWSGPAYRLLRRELRSFRPQIAHFHNTFPLLSPAVYYACHREGVPVVQTLHNYRLLCPAATLFRNGAPCEECLATGTPWPGLRHGCYRGSRAQTAAVAAMLALHRALRTWDRRVDAYIALTDFARRKFVQGGLPEAKVLVKPNFVDPAPPASSGDGTYALFVGRLSPEKGVRTLLEAWRTVKGVPLVVVGDGPLRQEVEAAAALLGEHRLRPLGRQGRGQVLALMREARFLVFPSSWYETFGVVLVEAFACGLPVVAARLGAAAEIVGDGRTGLHFGPADSRDLASKVQWLWSRPAQAREMGREARAEFERSYTAPRSYGILMSTYERLLEGRLPC